MSDPTREQTVRADPAAGWLDYRSARATGSSSVVGDLRLLPALPSPQIGGAREILVLLPAGAARSGRRYPVLYMHDGQNLFDAATSFAGEWQVDETLDSLRAEGIELIVVGIPNGGDRRPAEYTPYEGRVFRGGTGGAGPAYLRFLVETVKPAVDAAFPTRTEREATGVMGSSLGGLISLWAGFEHASTFGLVGAMSPAFPPGQFRTMDLAVRAGSRPERVYVDVGTREGSMMPLDKVAPFWSRSFRQDVRRARDALLAAGYREGESLRYVEEPGAIHHESAWARRLPDALRFLFGPLVERP